MYEAHFSFVVIGSHQDGRWAGYAFDDTEFDEEDLYEKISPCEGFNADPIASDLLSDDDIDADMPIWNSREYFLNTVARRMAQAADSWGAVVRAIEKGIKEYVSCPTVAIFQS